MNAADEGGVAGERARSRIGGPPSLESRLNTALSVGLMSAIGLGMLAWYYTTSIKHEPPANRAAFAASARGFASEAALPPLGRLEPPAPASASISAAADAPEIPLASATASLKVPLREAGEMPAEKTPEQRVLERQLSGMAFARAGVPGAAGIGGTADAGPASGVDERLPRSAPAAATVADAGILAPWLRTGNEPGVRARTLATQRLLLPRGAFIDCTLETAIDSSLPGMTTCVTATDTFGADGKVVLLERGTKIVGETRGEVQPGAARVFVLWTEARTPTGVVIPLASPGTDELGRSGMAGTVNRHFWERFGAAILISTLDLALDAAARGANGSPVIVNASGPQTIVTEVLRSTLNVPPTIVKRQGDRIQILVAHDLNFQSVYRLHAIR